MLKVLNRLSIDLPLILDGFVVANLAFLGLDIYLAHSVNDFARSSQWIPFWFSIVAAVALFLVLVADHGQSPGRVRILTGSLLGVVSIVIGIVGMLLHLDSHFFSQATLKNLVYTAPFAAPLAYAGLGFVLLMNRMVPVRSSEWACWIIFLALGGFVGNFALSLCDHAQNGFFSPSEWIPVASSSFAIGFLSIVLLFPVSASFLNRCLMMMGLQTVVALVGFSLHLVANLTSLSTSILEKFLYGAPIFAPLLFADLAVLGAIGLWDLKNKMVPSGTTPFTK